MKHVDHSSLEPAEGYHVHERMSAIEMQKGQNDPEFIRYKRYFFEARQAELIEETKKVAPLKHPHLIRLIGIVKMREEKTKQGKIVTKFLKKYLLVIWFTILLRCSIHPSPNGGRLRKRWRTQSVDTKK